MRNYTLLVALLAAMAWQAGAGKAAADDVLAKMDGDVIARFHFVGTDRIAADPKAAKLNELGALPATAELREKTLAKLSTAPFRLLESKLYNQTKSDYASLLRPLLDDLLHCESYAELRGPTNEVPELMLAVQVNNTRAILWDSSLSSVLTAWTGIPVTRIQGDGFTGWELKKHDDPNVIRYLRAGDWVLFGWGWDDLRLQPRFLQMIKQKRRPVDPLKDDWLDVVMDWPSYQAHHAIALPSPLPAKLPKMHLSVSGRKDFIRPVLTMLYPEPLGLTLEPWRIPTNAIHNPIVSFTAARGVAPWLSQLPETKELHLDPVPNQFIFWAMDKVPFETRLAVPVAGASNYLAQLAPRLIADLNQSLSKRSVPGEASWTNHQIVLSQIPFLSPYLRAIQDPTGEFLAGGLFPSTVRKDALPVPRDLIREIMSKPKLVYYDWEINQVRVMQWHDLDQIYLLAAGMPLPNGDMAAHKWIEAAQKLVGNCGTEVTLTAANELTLVRNGPVGLTGFEMNLLAYWLDAPAFPWHPVYNRILPAGLNNRPMPPGMSNRIMAPGAIKPPVPK